MSNPKSYKLVYSTDKQELQFGISSRPPKLIKLGSGEIIQWKNTIDGRAIYKDAELVEFNWLLKTPA